MPNGTGWLSLVGFLGLAVAVDAQTLLSQTAGSQFNGTDAFVSSTKVTETNPNRIQCPELGAGSPTIINGQARLPAFEGTVDSQGELLMRHTPEPYGRAGWSECPVLRVTSAGE